MFVGNAAALDFAEAKDDHDQAIAEYPRAIKLNPKHAAAYNNRGVAYAAKGDYDRAIADYNEAIDIDPQAREGLSRDLRIRPCDHRLQQGHRDRARI
jgi:tetratricopeptide (TPR) repeat protein